MILFHYIFYSVSCLVFHYYPHDFCKGKWPLNMLMYSTLKRVLWEISLLGFLSLDNHGKSEKVVIWETMLVEAELILVLNM